MYLGLDLYLGFGLWAWLLICVVLLRYICFLEIFASLCEVLGCIVYVFYLICFFVFFLMFLRFNAFDLLYNVMPSFVLLCSVLLWCAFLYFVFLFSALL